ncbi:hypothetical protein J2S07_003971 [Robertmurraya andreesenii]|uniref:Uncharacterized protein n=1 Tax=Anoxybacillus andreesenii TaxID=1325932 RepID=A0ABT9V9I9_9BACL|nr:hypothetical protein [Robertmurraya andreesenii]
MDQDFRKKMFRGAKIEDVILELEKLSQLRCLSRKLSYFTCLLV